MTVHPTEHTDEAALERLCVAARGVVDGLPGLMDDGLTGSALQSTTAHAVTLADWAILRALSPGDVHAHGTALYDALAAIGSDQSLTHAVWVGDALVR